MSTHKPTALERQIIYMTQMQIGVPGRPEEINKNTTKIEVHQRYQITKNSR